MDENAMRQWFIDCFDGVQGEMAWNQLSQLPDEIREQLMSQDIGKLPKPEEVQSLMQAFTAGGLNTFGDMKQTVESGVDQRETRQVHRIAEGERRRLAGNGERAVGRHRAAGAQRGQPVAGHGLHVRPDLRRGADAHTGRLGRGHAGIVGEIRQSRSRSR